MLVLEKSCKILCGKNDNHHHGQIDLHYFAMTFKNDGPHTFDILTLSSMAWCIVLFLDNTKWERVIHQFVPHPSPPTSLPTAPHRTTQDISHETTKAITSQPDIQPHPQRSSTDNVVSWYKLNNPHCWLRAIQLQHCSRLSPYLVLSATLHVAFWTPDIIVNGIISAVLKERKWVEPLLLTQSSSPLTHFAPLPSPNPSPNLS